MATSPSTVRAERLLQLMYKRVATALEAFRQIGHPGTRPLEVELALVCKEAEKIIKNGIYLDHFKYDPDWETRFMKAKFRELRAQREKKMAEINAAQKKKPVEPTKKEEPKKEEPQLEKKAEGPTKDKPVFIPTGAGKVRVEFGDGTYKLVSEASAAVLKKKYYGASAEPTQKVEPTPQPVHEKKVGTPVVVKPVKRSPKIAPPK